MSKGIFHFNLLVDQETGDRIAAIAKRHSLRMTTAARALVLERLDLYAAGWDLNDERRKTALEAVARLNEKKFARLVEFLKADLTPRADQNPGEEEVI